MTDETKNTAEEVLEALDLESMSPEEQETALVEIQELITQGVMVRVVERLTDEQRTAFEALLTSDADEDAVGAFLQENVPDMDALVAETVAELQGAILAETGTNTQSS